MAKLSSYLPTRPDGGNGYVQFKHEGKLSGDQNFFWDDINKYLGIGTLTPTDSLDVSSSGGVRIGHTTNAYAGTLRFNGSTFQGFDGTSWIAFAVQGGATVPGGSNTYIQYNDNGSFGGDVGLTYSGGYLSLTSGTSINEFSTDGTLGDNSDDAVPTEQAVKTYVDTGLTNQSSDMTAYVDVQISNLTTYVDNEFIKFSSDMTAYVNTEISNVINYIDTIAGDSTSYVDARVPRGTEGSIAFYGPDGNITEDNPNLYFNDTDNNVGIGTTNQFGNGAGVMGINDATTVPSVNPTSGGILYVEDGAGKWRSTSGTITTFGPADPHCPVCGRDYMLEYENGDDYLAVCMFCMTEELGIKPWILTRKQNRRS